jgi:hypothetical protein
MNSVPVNFWEWLGALDSGERTGLMVVCLWALFFLVAAVLFTIYKMHKNRMNDALKRELLDRGMSADEIALIVSATTTKGCASTRISKLGIDQP